MYSDTIIVLIGKQYDKQQDRDVFFSQNDAEVMISARKKLIKAWQDSQNSESQCKIVAKKFNV